jgi:NodT family efflux transporter outer membrane factor (OMF) lipoprotein
MRFGPILVTVSLLSACAYRADGMRPEVDMPMMLTETPGSTLPVWPETDWWHRFGSLELDSLIDQAKARNQDLAAASARVRQAAALARVARAPLLPAVGVAANLAATSSNDRTGVASGVYPDATLTASYEIDFWGRNSAAAASADATLRARRSDRAVVALGVVTSVANAYFQVLAAREQTAIAGRNLAAAEAMLRQVEARQRAGKALEREVAQQRALSLAQRASIPPLELAAAEAQATLAVLLGIPAQGFAVAGENLGGILPAPVTPGLPSDLLTRRPDIASAEAALAAAKADVAAARAAMFPRITLTGAAGVQSAALSSITEGASAAYFLIGGLMQPIFDNGALAGRHEQAKARQEELTALYRGAVMAAFADVRRSLEATTRRRQELEAQERVVAATGQAFALARMQYEAGAEDMLVLLDTQRTLFAAQSRLSQIRLARLEALIMLYKALGGGWQEGRPQ